MTMAWFYSSVAAYFLTYFDYSKYCPCKPVLHVTVFMNGTMRYRSEISKATIRQEYNYLCNHVHVHGCYCSAHVQGMLQELLDPLPSTTNSGLAGQTIILWQQCPS